MSFSNGPTVVTNGLVLALDAGDRNSYVSGSTTWFDLAGTNNGTLTNGPTFDSGSGGSIVFDGTNDYVLTSTNIFPSGLNPYTLDTWFYQPNPLTYSGSFESKIGVLFSGNAQNTIEVFLWDNITGSGIPSKISIGTYGAPTTPSGGIEVFISFPLQTWHNVTITRDSSYNITIYKNTNIIASGSINNNYPTGKLYHGGAPLNSNYAAWVNIRHAFTKIYNRALTPSEVLQNYNATKGRFGL
jgi:hypothetical protein